MRTLLTIIAAAGLLATPHHALAGAEPDDADLLGAKTVGVLPVLATGLSRQDTYTNVTAMALRGINAQAKGHGANLVEMTPSDDGGFAFAGESTAVDIRILRYAFIAGSLASNADDTSLFKQAVSYLEGEREALASLDPRLIAAMDRYVVAGRAGRVDAEALMASLSAAEEGIAKGPERAHGYFATGLWLGLSFLAVAAGEPDPNYFGMAVPLATLLLEDAAFGGSDVALAKEVVAIGALVSEPRADLAKLQQHLAAALAVEADAP